MNAPPVNVGNGHAWLMENVFFLSEDNNRVLAIERQGVRDGVAVDAVLVFDTRNVAPQHLNLLRAAPLLYQQLTYQYGLLQQLIDSGNLTEVGAALLTDMQNSIMLVQRAAIEGIEKVAEEIKQPEFKR